MTATKHNATVNTTAIVSTRTGPPQKATRAELLKATAQAMHEEEVRRLAPLQKQHAKDLARAKKKLARIAAPFARKSAVRISNNWKGQPGAMIVEFSVRISDHVAPKLAEAAEAYHTLSNNPPPSPRDVEQFMEELKAAGTADSNERVRLMLADPAVRKSLITFGTKTLSAADTAANATAIPV